MFYKAVAENIIVRSTQFISDLYHQGWVTAGEMAVDGQVYLLTMTQSRGNSR
jgi:hypothetical protein